MSQEFHSFAEAAALIPAEQLVALAWADIQRVVCPVPQGPYKKEIQKSRTQEAFESAIRRLQQKYPTAAAFRSAIPSLVFEQSAGISQEHLYSFAGRWHHYENTQRTLAAARRNPQQDVVGTLVLQGHGRSARAVTLRELEAIRQRKAQRKMNRGESVVE